MMTDDQVRSLLQGYLKAGIVWYSPSNDVEGRASDGTVVCLNPSGCHSSALYDYLRHFPTPDKW